MRILIVEDCVDFCKLVQAQLRKKFHAEFIVAYSGHEAAELLSEKCFDLVVSDFHMPEGSGDWLHAFMRKQNETPPMILFTSAPQEVRIQLDHVLKAVIAKPDFKTLFAKMNEILDVVVENHRNIDVGMQA